MEDKCQGRMEAEGDKTTEANQGKPMLMMEILKTCLFGMKYLSKKKDCGIHVKARYCEYEPVSANGKLAEVRGGPGGNFFKN